MTFLCSEHVLHVAALRWLHIVKRREEGREGGRGGREGGRGGREGREERERGEVLSCRSWSPKREGKQ